MNGLEINMRKGSLEKGGAYSKKKCNRETRGESGHMVNVKCDPIHPCRVDGHFFERCHFVRKSLRDTTAAVPIRQTRR